MIKKNAYHFFIIILISIYYNILSINCETITWVGSSSSQWNISSNWLPEKIPDNNDIVIISKSNNIDGNITIHINENITINGLLLDANGVNLHINEDIDYDLHFNIEKYFNFSNGILIGNGTFNIKKNCLFHIYNQEEKIIDEIKLNNYGHIIWEKGDIIFRNGAQFNNYGIIDLNDNDDTSLEKPLTFKYSTSSYYFDVTPNTLLNTEVILNYVLPAYDALYDLIFLDAVPNHITNTFENMAIFFHDNLLNVYSEIGFASDLQMYNVSIRSKTLEECADLCFYQYNEWCQSFDYLPLYQLCYLSEYQKEDVGGLESDLIDDNTFNYTLSTVFSHYELNNNKILNEPIFNNYYNGIINYNNGIYFESEIKFNNYGKLNFNSRSQIDLQNGGEFLTNNAILNFTNNNITFNEISRPILMLSGNENFIFDNNININGSGLIYLLSNHKIILPSNINEPNLNIKLNNEVNVIVSTLNDYSYYNINKLILSSSSKINFNNITLNCNNMILNDYSLLYGNNINFNINEDLYISSNSQISSNSGGYKSNNGIGSGISNDKGGSGGSHGGLGGNGYNEYNVGNTYGSYYLPNTYGSGGGSTKYGLGGQGGGIILIKTKNLINNGLITSNGEDGSSLTAGGGGSGGSILLNITNNFTSTLSSGIISVNGGNGGYPGGWLSGGSGGGGHLAIYIKNLYNYNGKLQAYGGTQTTQYNSNYNTGGAGTIYLEYYNNNNILKNDLIIDNNNNNEIIEINNGIENIISYDSSKTIIKEFNQNINNLYINNGGHLSIENNINFIINNIISDNTNTILKIQDNSNLNIPDNTILKNINLHILNGGTINKNLNLTLSYNTTLNIYDTGSTYNNPLSYYTFNELNILNNGILKHINDGIITLNGTKFNIYNNGILDIINNSSELLIKFDITNFNNYAIIKSSSLNSKGILRLYNVTNIYPNLLLNHIDIYNHNNGKINWYNNGIIYFSSNTNLINYGNININENNINNYNYITSFNYINNTSKNSKLINNGGKINIKNNNNITSINIKFHNINNGKLYISNGNELQINGGGLMDDTSLIQLNDTNTILSFNNNTFKFNENSKIHGNIISSSYIYPIKIIIDYNAIVYLPNNINSNDILILIQNNGIVRLNNFLHSFHNITLNNNGNLLCQENCNANIKNLFLNNGIIDLSTSGIFNITNEFNIKNGIIKGKQGNIYSSNLLNIKNTLNNEIYFLDDINILNDGICNLLNTNLLYAQSSNFINRGILNIYGNVNIKHANALYNFTKVNNKHLVAWPPVLTLENTTPLKCAERCNEHNIEIGLPRPLGNIYLTKKECLGFNYNEKINVCHLNIINRNELNVNLETDLFYKHNWNYYERESNWSTLSYLINNENGIINKIENEDISYINIPLNNKGNINIQKSTILSINNGGISLSNSQFNLLNINSKLRFNGGIYKFKTKTNLLGNGTIEFLKGTYQLPDLINSNKLNINITDSSFVEDINELNNFNYTLNTINIYNNGILSLSNGIINLNNINIYNYGKFISNTNILPLTKTSLKNNIILNTNNITLNNYGEIQFDSSKINSTSNIYIYNTSKIYISDGYFISNLLYIDYYGHLSSDSLGYSGGYGIGKGIGNDYGGSGASYGGEGGNGLKTNITNDGYGNTYQPISYGSGGGSSLYGRGGRGGGKIKINTYNLINHGIISSNGESFTKKSASGGGSGGSILCYIDNILKGNGKFQIIGGNGGKALYNDIEGGGGSGGRIAIYVYNDQFTKYSSLNNKLLNYDIYGGIGYEDGASGTLYIEERDPNTLIINNNYLYVSNNNNYNTNKQTIIKNSILNNINNNKLKNIYLLENSKLNIKTSNIESINMIHGDNTGEIYFTNNTILNTPLLFNISNIHMILKDCIWKGTKDLILNKNTIISLYNNGKTNQTDSEGKYEFNNIYMNDYSKINYETYNHLNTEEIILIINNELKLTKNTLINANGNGYYGSRRTRLSSNELQGPGKGIYGENGAGGAGYGGDGGRGFSVTKGGIGYGSFITPTLYGSGGGSSSIGEGGSGGGYIRIETNILNINGTISANGYDGNNFGTSGGSGGSILIITNEFNGNGTISAHGGNGIINSNYYGTGGSGGRIAIKYTNITYHGNYKIYGGFNNINMTEDANIVNTLTNKFKQNILSWFQNAEQTQAASGTIFLQQRSIKNSNNILNQELIVSNEEIKNDIINNEIIINKLDKYYNFTFNNNFNVHSDFYDASYSVISDNTDNNPINKLTIIGNANLQIRNANITINSIYGDNTGRLSVANDSLLIFNDNINILNTNITIEPNSIISGKNITIDNESYLSLTTGGRSLNQIQGTYKFDIINIKNGTILIKDGGIHANYNNKLKIICNKLIINKNGKISSDARGYEGILKPDSYYYGIASTRIKNNTLIHEINDTSLISYLYLSPTSSIKLNYNYLGNGPLYGESSINYGGGGGHAGLGGNINNNNNNNQNYYGSIYNPLTFGSGGGSTYQSNGANGGGIIYIEILGKFINNGIISSNGGNCLGHHAGAGAGGSINIKSYGNIYGNGKITSNGGNPCIGLSDGDSYLNYNTGGAGAGGHISIRGKNIFNNYNINNIEAKSGIQNDTSLTILPSAGTIYLKDTLNDESKLIIKNSHTKNNNKLTGITYISENSPYGNVTTLDIGNNIDLYITGNNIKITLDEITSSSSIINNIYHSSSSKLPKVVIKNNAILQINYNNLNNFNLNNVELEIKDTSKLIGINNINLYNNSVLTLWGNGYGIKNNEIHSINGKYIFNKLYIGDESELRIKLSDNDCRDNTVHILANKVIIDKNGKINGNGYGYESTSEWNEERYNKRNGLSSNGYRGGGGGGHAGYGGNVVNNQNAGGISFGNTEEPIGCGGAGGSGPFNIIDNEPIGTISPGGNGGASIHLEILEKLVLNGTISMNGENAIDGTGSGGGAGGSIWIECKNALFTGYNGQIISNGGNGDNADLSIINNEDIYYGGAGSGGRISISYTNISWNGKIISYGGHHRQDFLINYDEDNIYKSLYKSYQKAGYDRLYLEASPGTVLLSKRKYKEWNNIEYQRLLIGSEDDPIIEYFDDDNITLSLTRHVTTPTYILHDNNIPLKLDKIKIDYDSEVIFQGNQRINITDTNPVNGKGLIRFTNDTKVSFLNSIHLSDPITLGIECGVWIDGDLILSNQSSLYLNENLYSIKRITNDNTILTFDSINLYNGSTIYGENISITIRNDINLYDGSSINTNSLGYNGGTPGYNNAEGPGAGGFGSVGGSGGGYGGRGHTGISGIFFDQLKVISLTNSSNGISDDIINSISETNSYVGGITYGNPYIPLLKGSGGGSTYQTNGYGGNGGGLLHLNINNNIYIDKTSSISSNGESSIALSSNDGGGGGGSGGSIYILCNNLYGNGTISANGGKGSIDSIKVTDGAGSGGGGRIAIYCNNMKNFNGTIETKTGSNNNITESDSIGNLGTIITKSNIINKIVAKNNGGDINYNNNDIIDIYLNKKRNGILQEILSYGTGNGSRYESWTQYDTIVRGYWRLKFQSSDWSNYLSAQATSEEVKNELISLLNLYSSIDLITVDKIENNEGLGNGWNWRIIFNNDLTNYISFIEIDDKNIYSTDFNAGMKVRSKSNYINKNEILDISNGYDNSTKVNSLFKPSENLGTEYNGYWLTSNIYRIIITNITSSTPPSIGSLTFEQNDFISTKYGNWLGIDSSSPLIGSFDDVYIKSITTPKNDGEYIENKKLLFDINFNTDVISLYNFPFINLYNINNFNNATATYISGNGTSTFQFEYIIQKNDYAYPLQFLTNSFNTSTGAILKRATSPFDLVDLTWPIKGQEGSFTENHHIDINGI